MTAFILLDVIAILPMLSYLFFGALFFVGGAIRTLQIALTWLAVVLPGISLIAGIWYGLKYEFVDKRRALIWAVMPWPMTAICVLFLKIFG